LTDGKVKFQRIGKTKKQVHVLAATA
jgi:hypothetical protein